VHYLVTGGAGFIGSNVIDTLLRQGHQVTAYDNLTTGMMEFLAGAGQSASFRFVEGDLLDLSSLTHEMQGVDFVFHFAANADVRHGTEHTRRDLEQNTIATYNVLEAMRRHNVKRIAFSSTGSIYGEPEVFPTPENAPFPVQTSLYGASKLAGEGLISAFCEGFGMQGYIFRFVSILGERYTHGHVLDFYRKLRANPHELYILGDGHQRKSYLYIQDCIAAIQTVIDKAQEKVNIYNLGTDEACEIQDSARWIAERLGLNPALTFAGGTRGWVGDSPFILLDTQKVRSLGWTPKLTIKEAVLKTVDYLRENEWVMERRA
jgi:UDP-glucose 4-epimerase